MSSAWADATRLVFMVLKLRPMVVSSVVKFVVISAVVEASCAVTVAVSMLAVAVTELARASCEA